MTATSDIYRDLMRFKPDGLSANAWAIQAGVSRTVWADMRRHGNPSRRTLEKLLGAAGSSLAEFEALRIGPEAGRASGTSLAERRPGWGPVGLPPLPVMASQLAGEWGEAGSRIELTEIRPGELIERLPRPASLAADADAFAITIVGDSMWPRFRPGSRIAVSPRAPVAIGDDVLVRLNCTAAGAQPALIKQLMKRSAASIELRQFNPDLTFAVDLAEVDAVLKIPGELI